MESHISLMELLEGITDPRHARGKRHPLPALLNLAVVAMLAGMSSYEAIVQFGKERGWDFLKLLGFTTRKGLCKATYSRVFRRIDVAEFEDRVAAWIRGRLGPGDAPHIAIDGKTARGSRDGGTPGAHLVAAYAPDVKAVLAQLRVDGGMTANNLLMQSLADVLDVPVVRPIVAETVSLGAAYAAGLAVGFWPDLDSLRQNWHRAAEWLPTMDAEIREKGYRKWKKAVARAVDWLDDDDD
jgi:hypothetical protein